MFNEKLKGLSQKGRYAMKSQRYFIGASRNLWINQGWIDRQAC
jgi:hypothetical protein